MADFVQTMKDWRRMCNTCQTEKDICGVCGCYPAGNYAPCAMKSMNKEADLARDNLYFERLEKIIKSWAAEHPEPVYPTWIEWFQQQNIWRKETNIPAIDLYNPIPADIAEKLGLEPKESV